MDSLNYLLLVNIYLVLFYAFYTLLLKNETFFKLNRIYLVGGASMSFLIPFLQSDWIRSLFITQQVEEVTQKISLTFSNQPMIIPVEKQSFDAGEIILFIYLAGAALCLLRFLWQLYKVQAILKSAETDHAFSFFNKVKVGSSVPNRETVYGHELVHARQWHSADVILFEIICIINWFNPVVYLYRKAIKYIHEFTADEVASRQEESKAAYAVVLLSKTFGITTHQLTNSFYNQSLLKRRIIMLHQSKSTRNALLKYGLSAPLFAAMMVLSSASFKAASVTERINDVSSEALDLIQSENLTESDYQAFLKRNSTVKALGWSSASKVIVLLKSGKKESYDLNNPAELKKAEGLYGSFPMPPPPPPPTSLANTLQVSLGADDGPIFTEVEVSPEFSEGRDAFYQYLTKNFKYPAEAIKKNINGKLIMQFVVDTTGKLTDIRVLRGLGNGLDEEAIRVLSASPNWKPGIQNGNLVRVEYTLPISISPPGQKTGAVSDMPIQGTSITSLDPNALFLVDGKQVEQSVIQTLDPKSFKAVNVLKGEKAIEKYGQKGKDGVVEIYIKETPLNLSVAESRIGFPGSTHIKTTESRTISGSGSKDKSVTYFAPDSITVKDGDITLQGKGSKIEVADYKGLTILDGIEITKPVFKELNSNTIESIKVLNGDSAVKKYGDRGKDGAIEITSKKK